MRDQAQLECPSQKLRMDPIQVSIAITIKHWGIHENDTYIADIINIRIIIPPLTPHKRKVTLTDPFDSKMKKSPTKKKTHDWPEGSL